MAVIAAGLGDPAKFVMKKLAVVLAVLLMSILSLSAQDSLNTEIKNHFTTNSPEALLLSASFIVADSRGNMIQDANVKGVEAILDGERYVAETSLPTSPFYILFLVDISGSMTSVYKQLVGVSQEIAESAPEQGQYAVMSFHGVNHLEQGFAPGMDSVVKAITDQSPISNSGTCVLNAVYTAASYVKDNTAPGRRAIIILTDGVDRTANGSAQCSSTTIEQIEALANCDAACVPVYAIGISGQDGLNSSLLESITARTGGYALYQGGDQLKNNMAEIMTSLSQQWFVQIPLYARQGPSQVIFTPILENDVRAQSVTLDINSPRNYSKPLALCESPKPPIVEGGLITYQICFEGAERIGSLEAFLVEDKNQVPNSLQQVTDVSQPLRFDGAALRLEPGQSYAIVINGKDTSGNQLFAEPIYAPFDYNVATASNVVIEIDYFDFDETNENALFTVKVKSGLERITGLKVKANSDRGPTDFNKTFAPVPLLEEKIPLNQLAANTGYTLVIEAVDAQDMTIGLDEQKFTAPEAKQVSFLVEGEQIGTDRGQVLHLSLSGRNLDGATRTEATLYQGIKPVWPLNAGEGSFKDMPAEIDIPISNLSSGEYILRVKVFGDNGALAEHEEEVALSITFSFGHQLMGAMSSPLLLILVAALGGALGFGLLRRYRWAKFPISPNQAHQSVPVTSFDRRTVRITDINPPSPGVKPDTIARRETIGVLKVRNSQTLSQNKTHAVSLSLGDFIIGSDMLAHLCLRDDGFVSGQHLRIYREGSHVMVVDKGSRNGTMMNGSVLEKNTPQLLPGHTITEFVLAPRLNRSQFITDDRGNQHEWREVSITYIPHGAEKKSH